MPRRVRSIARIFPRHWGPWLAAGAVAAALLTLECGGKAPLSPTAPTSVSAVPTTTISTAPAILSSAPEVLVGAGDISMCDGRSELTARLLDRVGGIVFTLGDHAYYHGTEQEFRDCYDPSWGRHRYRTRPVPGNHDYETAGAEPYYAYFGAAAGPSGAGYYSYDAGAWHVVALNSNVGIRQQAAWLQRDLAANPSACTLAYWHHPLFTSGPDGSTGSVQALWQVLYDAGAEVILNGHEHFYERFGPQDPSGRADPERGIRQFVVGTGGAALYPVVTVAPNSEVRTSAFGVLKLTLSPGRYEWEFLPVDGPADAGTGTCH